jgi:hypothetical protein
VTDIYNIKRNLACQVKLTAGNFTTKYD